MRTEVRYTTGFCGLLTSADGSTTVSPLKPPNHNLPSEVLVPELAKNWVL